MAPPDHSPGACPWCVPLPGGAFLRGQWSTGERDQPPSSLWTLTSWPHPRQRAQNRYPAALRQRRRKPARLWPRWRASSAAASMAAMAAMAAAVPEPPSLVTGMVSDGAARHIAQERGSGRSPHAPVERCPSAGSPIDCV
jgi:hypothetical protein